MSTGSIRENKEGSRVVDELFSILVDPHRRIALQYLLDQDSAIHVDDLLDELASDGDSADGEVSRVHHHIRLVHIHLPKLSAVGAVEYDSETGILKPTPVIEEVKPYLEWARTNERN